MCFEIGAFTLNHGRWSGLIVESDDASASVSAGIGGHHNNGAFEINKQVIKAIKTEFGFIRLFLSVSCSAHMNENAHKYRVRQWERDHL